MTGTTLFFVILGVCVVVEHLMKLVIFLDTPRRHAHRSARPASPAASGRVTEFPVAELALEKALHAA